MRLIVWIKKGPFWCLHNCRKEDFFGIYGFKVADVQDSISRSRGNLMVEVYYTVGKRVSKVISETMGHAPDMVKNLGGQCNYLFE